MHNIDILLVSKTYRVESSLVRIRGYYIFSTNHPSHGETAINIKSLWFYTCHIIYNNFKTLPWSHLKHNRVYKSTYEYDSKYLFSITWTHPSPTCHPNGPQYNCHSLNPLVLLTLELLIRYSIFIPHFYGNIVKVLVEH